jgi:hypothetical protein
MRSGTDEKRNLVTAKLDELNRELTAGTDRSHSEKVQSVTRIVRER